MRRRKKHFLEKKEINMMKEASMSRDMGMAKQMSMSNGHGGHLYTQTNETRNSVIHYRRSADGELTEVE